ncbi:hypothetical protein M0R72_07975 [Candidatus Pacearchaeota archaeon]|jgi:hypothetical protein|nr:hypothetical protein [Candidatus Pacearchaeota archaeon]
MKQKLIDLIVRCALKLVARYNNGVIRLPSKMNLVIISSEQSTVRTSLSRWDSVRVTAIDSEPFHA